MQGAAHGLLRGRKPQLARGHLVEHDGLGGIVLVEPRIKQPARDGPDAVLLEERRADLPHLERDGPPTLALELLAPRVALAADRIGGDRDAGHRRLLRELGEEASRGVVRSELAAFVHLEHQQRRGIESRRTIDGEARLPGHGQREAGEPHGGGDLQH